jgi:hypothetical protein
MVMSESGEVRLVPVSGEQRDALVRSVWGDDPENDPRSHHLRALVAEWDAAVPGVLSGVEEARWLRSYAAEVQREARLGEWPEDYAGVVLDMLARSATLLERTAAGGERPSVSLRETIEERFRAHGITRDENVVDGWRTPDGVLLMFEWAVCMVCAREDRQVEREAEEGERDE